MKLKVCGITRLEDARYVVAAGATHLGFIQDKSSPRYVEPTKAKEIIDWVFGAVTVGVFVNQEPHLITEICSKAGFDMVQLHGDEPPEICKELPMQVIKAIAVQESDTSDALQQRLDTYADCVDWFLLDTPRRTASEPRSSFDWKILDSVRFDRPCFLAGGINETNVTEALEMLNPPGIDISSGLESAPGIKDFDKVDAFMTTVSKTISL